MNKSLFITVISLLSKPSSTWKELNEKRTVDQESFLPVYFYPFTGLITLAAFIGVLFTQKEFDLQTALKESILAFLTVFGGFFLASYLLNEIGRLFFHRERNMKLCQCFVGYSSSLSYVLNIVLSFLPEFFFMRFLVLYTFYVVWEGAIPYMKVNESEQFKFVVVSTLVIILAPSIIGFIVGKLMPGLNG